MLILCANSDCYSNNISLERDAEVIVILGAKRTGKWTAVPMILCITSSFFGHNELAAKTESKQDLGLVVHRCHSVGGMTI